MLTSRLRRFLHLQQLSFWIAGTASGIVLSVLANYLTDNLDWLYIVVAIGVAALVVGVVTSMRKINEIEVAIHAPQTIDTPAEAKMYARKAFVGFVPLYKAKEHTPAAQLTPTERHDAVVDLAFDRLCVEESNLKPTIEAIVAHSASLQHCWLLTTAGKDKAGSHPYARLLAEYLRQCKGLTCEFHYGPEYTISLDADAAVLGKTYDHVKQVLGEAADKQIGHNEIVADITTGVRSMVLGMVLACLDKDRDIEFIGTNYDDNGRPSGPLLPIIFGFELADT